MPVSTSRPPRGRPSAGGDDDAALSAAVAERDPAALEQLYRRYARPCYSLARRVLGEDALAQDVVQDVFLALWRDPARFDPSRGAFASWLLAMTHHKAVDVVRREENARRRRAPIDLLDGDEEAGPAVVDEVLATLRRDQVRTALGALPDPQRQALALAYFGGYTQREIAGITGTPLGTVKTRMLLGMRRLRVALRGSDAGPSDRSGSEAVT